MDSLMLFKYSEDKYFSFFKIFWVLVVYLTWIQIKIRCRFNNIFVREAAEIFLRTSLIFVLALLCELTPKGQVKVFSNHLLSILKNIPINYLPSKQRIRQVIYSYIYLYLFGRVVYFGNSYLLCGLSWI